MGDVDISRFPVEIQMLLGEVLDLTYPEQGCTSQVTIIKSSKGQYVIKKSCGQKYCRWVQQEYRVLVGLSQTWLSVPKPYQLIENANHESPECWLVMGLLQGETLRSVLERTDDVKMRRKLLYSFGEVLSQVHSVSPPVEMLENKSPWIDRKLDEAEFYLANYKVDGTPELLQQLRTSRPHQVQPTLIHGDFTLDNVLVQGDAVTGIIDWAGGAYGDPRYDIALAIRPDPACFDSEKDIHAFFEGYGSSPLSREEYDYFNGIYEFF